MRVKLKRESFSYEIWEKVKHFLPSGWQTTSPFSSCLCWQIELAKSGGFEYVRDSLHNTQNISSQIYRARKNSTYPGDKDEAQI